MASRFRDTWIAIDNGFMQSEPTTALDWKHCADSNMPSSKPCAGLDVPVWDNTTTPVIGDIYEYPANSDTFYEIIFIHDDPNGGPDWIGNPVDSGADEFEALTTAHVRKHGLQTENLFGWSVLLTPGNYVVEWPAGSSNLDMPLEPTGVSSGAGEPGVDTHWGIV